MKTLPIPEFLLDLQNPWTLKLLEIGQQAFSHEETSTPRQRENWIEQINQVMHNYVESHTCDKKRAK
jgi:hypothetical protein